MFAKAYIRHQPQKQGVQVSSEQNHTRFSVQHLLNGNTEQRGVFLYKTYHNLLSYTCQSLILILRWLCAHTVHNAEC